MKTIKTVFLTEHRWIPLVLAMTAVVSLICYNAFAQPRHGTGRAGSTSGTRLPFGAQIPDRAAHPGENDPEHARMLQSLRSSKVSSDEFAKAFDAARALPPSPLLQRRFAPAGWTFAQVSPIDNEYGHGCLVNCGSPTPSPNACLLPFPTPPPPDGSACGASALIRAIGVDPTNADVVYVGSEGGLAKSTNGGQNWTYLSDLPPTPFLSQSIRSIAIDPVDHTIVYVGTGMTEFFGKGIYRSTDAGATWTQLGSTEFTAKRVLKIVIDPATAGSATSTTLYASVVKGAPNNDPGHCGDSPGNCAHSVWKSTDSGLDWTQIRSVAGPADMNGSTYYDLAIQKNARPASTLYVTSPDVTSGTIPTVNPIGVVYKVDGSTWTKIRSFPDAFVPSFLALAQSGGQPVLYLGYSDSGNHAVTERSTDQGSHWTPLSAPGVGELFALGVDLADHSVDQHILVAGATFDATGPHNLVFSTDGGWSWHPAAHYPEAPCHDRCEVHIDVHSVAFCPTNPLRNYVGTDGGIYRADDSGPSLDPSITWWSKNENLPGALMNGVSLGADGSMVMGNNDNGTQLYAAPTPNPPWVMVKGGDGYKPKIDQTISNGYNRYYYQSTLSGGPLCCYPNCYAVNRVFNGHWADITPPEACNRGERSAGYPALFVAPSDGQRVIVGFEYVYRSTNSGDSWTRIGPSPTPSPMPSPVGEVSAVYEAPTNTNVIYAIIDYTRIVTTSNATDWALRPTPNPDPGFTDVGRINAITVSPSDPTGSTAYVACDRGVWKTIDMGASWISQQGIGRLTSNLVYQDVVIDPLNPDHVFVASAGGVSSTTNGGLTWSDMSAGIPAGMAVTSLSLNNTRRQLAASTFGRGVYIFDLGP